jgi:transcriptional regulator with XRE-family HTH domain
MVRFKEKLKALALRRKGKSLQEISDALGVSKSAISFWCRDICLNQKQILRLKKRQITGSRKGSLLVAERRRSLRDRDELFFRSLGLREIGAISQRDLFIAGIAIYWSEGYTYASGNEVGFTNSDPKMVLLMLEWFKKFCEVSQEKFSLSIRINEMHRSRVKKVEDYWSSLTKIPLSQFNKTVLIKSLVKKVYPNSDNYYGTLRIVVLRGSQLRRRINGWLQGLEEVVTKKNCQGSSAG